jgi:uncharacterized protein with FMN-binding domain|nr:MAG: hypothetical protein TU35_01410 [Thermoproteus sp. AZ2]
MPVAEIGLLAIFVASIAVLAVVMYLLVRTSERPQQNEKKPRVVSVVKCNDGREIRRDYKDGEYVGAVAQDCPDGVIIGVYKEGGEYGV